MLIPATCPRCGNKNAGVDDYSLWCEKCGGYIDPDGSLNER